MTRFYRYAVVTPDADGSLPDLSALSAWSRIGELEDRTVLLALEFDHAQFQRWQDTDAVFVLPSLGAPAEKLSGRPADFFARHGIQARPGDTVLNLLRSLRDAKRWTVKIDNLT